jgi:hypothetical protein
MVRQELSVADIEKIAETVASSELFPGWKTKEEVMTLMMLAQSEGVPAITAMNRYDMINKRISKKSQACLSDFIAQGGKIEWLKSDNEKAQAKFTTPGGVEHVEDFNLDDARRAELVKPHSNWTKYPKSMLRARVITFGLRAVWPQALNMMLSSEEAQDMPAARTEKRVEQSEVKLIEETPAAATKPKLSHIETPKPLPTISGPLPPNGDVIIQYPEPPKPAAKAKKATKPAAPVEKPTASVKEFIASFPADAVQAFMADLGWDSEALTSQQLAFIDNNREKFAAKVAAFEKTGCILGYRKED